MNSESLDFSASYKKKLIECYFPVRKINLDSILEAGFKGASKELRNSYIRTFGTKPMVVGPRLRNIHTWFARRPCSVARALTLGAVIEECDNQSVDLLEKSLGVNKIKKTEAKYNSALLFYTTPDRELIRQYIKSEMITICDPMSGGGSIPLESLRLGFRTVAVDYNPVAYLVLRATVEFPAKYADAGLFEETLRAAKEFISRARSELGMFYGDDAENYIFARGVRCPFCGGLIPVQGVAPEITKKQSFKRRFLRITYDAEAKTFHAETVPSRVEGGLAKRGNNIKCPYCGRWFQLRGVAKSGETGFDVWFRRHAELMRKIVELMEPVTPELEEEMLSLHIPLVKQVGNSFIAIWEDNEERKRFISALRTLSNEAMGPLATYIPLDDIPNENRWARTARNKGLTKWYMLFNPRQLLTIAKLAQIVAEIAQKQYQNNGEFGAAVALYLAFSIDKIADYNTIATKWQGSQFKTGIGNTLRGESTIDFRQEYVEMVVTLPHRSLEWALEPDIATSNKLTKTAGGILPVLRFLCDEFRGAGLGDRISVYLGDATRLSSILGVGSVDVINVDPPYFEQVIYSDKSEFFWVILRRALAPVLDVLFKNNRLNGWSHHSPTVPREREVVTYNKRDREGRFRGFFSEFINEAYRVLKDDGVLVLWFTHPTDTAWRTVGNALYDAGFVVSKVWPVQTEMKTRYKKQVNQIAQETSLIIVARKYERRVISEVGSDVKRDLMSHPEFVSAVEEVTRHAVEVASEVQASPADTIALLFGSALSVATRFEIIGREGFDELFEAAAAKITEFFIIPLVEKILTSTGSVKLSGDDTLLVKEFLRRAMLRDSAVRSYIALWFLSRVDLQTGMLKPDLLPIDYNFAQTVAKLLGYDVDRLREYGFISEQKNKPFVPVLFDVLSSAARIPFNKLVATTLGRSVYFAYLAMNESGAPELRAKTIRSKFLELTDDEIGEAAAIGIVLIETARNEDLGGKDVKSGTLEFFIDKSTADIDIKRRLGIQTLLQLIPKA